MQSCLLPGLTRHLVHELNVGTVRVGSRSSIFCSVVGGRQPRVLYYDTGGCIPIT